MTSRKLFTVAKKIQLKLAQLAAEETVVQGNPPGAPKDESSIFIYDKPKNWSSSKVLEFQKLMNAWGKEHNYEGNLLKEDGVWGPETTTIARGFWANPDLPNSAKQGHDSMYDYFKSLQLLRDLPKGKFMTDKRQNPVSSEFISAVQSKLKEMGTYSGPVDGRWNSEGMNALAKFQKDIGAAKQDGFSVDEQTQTKLGL